MATCPNGHERTPDNTYQRPNGYTECRECRREGKQRKRGSSGEVAGPSIEAPPGKTIRTVDELLAYHEIDPALWAIERQVVNYYEQAGRDGEGSVEVTPQSQLKVFLRPRVREQVVESLWQGMLDDLRSREKTGKAPKLETGTVLLELAGAEPHIGKMAWGEETGHEDYDSGIAVRLMEQGTDTLLQRASGFAPARNVLVVGNDFFNADSALGTTTAGTRQDVDSRYAKMFRRGVQTVRSQVKRALALAPTDIICVWGNHDTQTLWDMGEVLAALYEGHKYVTVSNAPTQRKYYRWGTVLLGWTHGDKEKLDKLPNIMATERKQDWAETTHREWHVGHGHRKKEWSDEFTGVRVRMLPSITSPDAWHASLGYVGATRAMEAYLWDQGAGYLGHVSHTVRE